MRIMVMITQDYFLGYTCINNLFTPFFFTIRSKYTFGTGKFGFPYWVLKGLKGVLKLN